MRLYTRIIILLVVITISLELTNAKKRNSGGSKPSKPSKPPGSTIKKLKKAALIGAGVYVGYKLTKAAAKVSNICHIDELRWMVTCVGFVYNIVILVKCY